ncbi:MAG: hypothetical protein RLZZ217_922 [Planctomycetota bacterium]|jgi:hypothetical protein
MRVTVIFPDATVYVDGEARQVALPAHDPNWRALQWHGDRGDVEVRVGAAFAINDSAIVEPFVAAWRAAVPAPASPSGQPATGVEEM